MESADLPDNCVEYKLFILDENGVTRKCVTDIQPQLKFLIGEAYACLAKEIVEYIWHVEPFRLSVMEKPFSHIGGRTVYGDSIEDEWFIVHLMMEISKRWDNTAIAMRDNDGQFLLIEAAEYLPAWLGPENSENRVWIHRGQIHIVPEVVNKSQNGVSMEEINVEDALTWIAKDPSFTVASKKIQETIGSRVKGYPQKIRDLQHRMQCCVPASVAVLATTKPSLVSAAIQAFYLRDPIDLRACRAMKHFPPETRVLTNIIISKLQYAQLIRQKFHPDKRTGWDLPTGDDPHYKALDLGVKLASGFEMLCACGERVQNTDEVIRQKPEDKEQTKFYASLESSGYFQKAKPGSADYVALLNRAKDFFTESHRDYELLSAREYFGAVILKLIRAVDVDIEYLKKLSHKLPPADDDSWLNISPEEIDSILRKNSLTSTSDSGTSQTSFDPSMITGSMKRFMDTISGLEGVEFPDEKGDPHGMMDDTIGKILELNISEDEEDEGRNSSAMTDYSDEEDHPFELAKGSLIKLQSYLQQMDRELASTAVGQSFERRSGNKSKQTSKKVPDNGVNQAHGHSHRKVQVRKAGFDDFLEEESDPVDVQVNLLKNILDSCSSEQGMPGPASNILKRMGVTLPPNGMDSDDE